MVGFFTSMDKFLKYFIIFSIIAMVGAIGSIIETYVKTNGWVDVYGFVGAIIILCIFYFWASVLGKFFDLAIKYLK
jgi:hypothetical protein